MKKPNEKNSNHCLLIRQEERIKKRRKFIKNKPIQFKTKNQSMGTLLRLAKVETNPNTTIISHILAFFCLNIETKKVVLVKKISSIIISSTTLYGLKIESTPNSTDVTNSRGKNNPSENR